MHKAQQHTLIRSVDVLCSCTHSKDHTHRHMVQVHTMKFVLLINPELRQCCLKTRKDICFILFPLSSLELQFSIWLNVSIYLLHWRYCQLQKWLKAAAVIVEVNHKTLMRQLKTQEMNHLESLHCLTQFKRQ